MGWGRAFFLGDLGNWLDTDDNSRKIGTLREHLRNKSHVDRSQDGRIAALEQENDQLKLYLSSLAQLLVDKGVLARAEVAGIVEPIDDGEPGAG